MQSLISLPRSHAAFAFTSCLAAIALLAGCGGAKSGVAPSALVNDPAKYDGQTITVSGTAKVTGELEGRRGMMTRYQLCDGSCINVVQFGETGVKDGSRLTLTGRFRAGSESSSESGSSNMSSGSSHMRAGAGSGQYRRGQRRRRRHHPANVLIVGGQQQ